MGYDALAPAMYTYNKDQDGNITTVQSHTILGNGIVDAIFQKNVPGMWFTQQGDEVLDKLMKCYKEHPYPTDEDMQRLAEEFGAPGVTQIKTFFNNMHLKEQNGYL